MPSHELDTDHLVQRASRGDASAVEKLLGRHRDRLRRMVSVRLDRRLASRVDPSDVVQETLAEAHRRLRDYARTRPLPFYPWLRQIAWNRLIDLHRRHITSGRRSVTQEEPLQPNLSNRSAEELAQRLAASGTSPELQLLRKELRDRVREALQRLSPMDREILVLRHLEQLSIAHIAATLGVAEGTVKSRHFRALERLRVLLTDDERERKGM